MQLRSLNLAVVAIVGIGRLRVVGVCRRAGLALFRSPGSRSGERIGSVLSHGGHLDISICRRRATSNGCVCSSLGNCVSQRIRSIGVFIMQVPLGIHYENYLIWLGLFYLRLWHGTAY